MAKQRKLDEKQERKIGLFDLVNDISSDKKYLFNDDTAAVYAPFMINKAFSQHVDTIMLANEMNKRPSLSKEMHHDFMFYSIDTKKRYGKWAKQENRNVDVINYIKEQYAIGNERALEYLDLMTEDEVKQIEATLKSKGGKK